MTQPFNERRFRLLEPPPPCRICESSRVTRVGLVEGLSFFRCGACGEVFTIPCTAQARDTDHEAHEGT